MPGIRRLCIALCAGLIPAVYGQTPAADEPLEEVVVTGEFPGPGMWRVTRADDAAGHVLWIVGDPPPLPRRMKWKSRDVEAVAVSAQEIVLDAGVSMEPDERIGVFKGLSLLPAALKARKNPDQAGLRDLLPPEVYARWLVQKRRFLGSDNSVEHWRPIFAADKLRREAFDDLGLRERGMVWEVVEKLAKKRNITTTTPNLKFTFPTSGLKTKIQEFSRESLADTECFVTTLDLTEALSNPDIESQRAHAWATADLTTLERLPPLPNPYTPCAMALLNTEFAKAVVPADIREQLYALWIGAAEKSLGANQTTLAIVPLGKLLRTDGYLDRLRAKGYLIEAPK
jgi:TraB/PrgY/gumN family